MKNQNKIIAGILIVLLNSTFFSCQKLRYGIPEFERLELSSPRLDTLKIHSGDFSTLPVFLQKDSTLWGIWLVESSNNRYIYVIYSKDSDIHYINYFLRYNGDVYNTMNDDTSIKELNIFNKDGEFYWHDKSFDRYYCISSLDSSLHIYKDSISGSIHYSARRLQYLNEYKDQYEAFQAYCRKNDVGTIARWCNRSVCERFYKEGSKYKVLFFSSDNTPEICTVRLVEQDGFILFEDGDETSKFQIIGFRKGDTSRLYTIPRDKKTGEFIGKPEEISRRIPLENYIYNTITDSVLFGKGFKWEPGKQ